MGHPDRKLLREKKEKDKMEEGLGKRNNLGIMDLTPYNAVSFMALKRSSVTYK